MPFEKGNQLAANSKRWQMAIENALKERNKSRKDKLDALDELAEKLLLNADQGDMQALKELGDRLDGKSVQAVEQKTEHSGNIKHDVEIRIIDNPT